MKIVKIQVPEGRTPMVAICSVDECRHIWIAMWLPMNMLMAAAVMKSLHCPLCGNARPSCADLGHGKHFVVEDNV